jgi:hypothetical protein
VSSDRRFVRGASGGRDPAFSVVIGGRDMAVALEFLNLADIDPGSEKTSGGRGAE